MKVFVAEFVCGGGLGNGSASLLREGRAMLAAVLADFARVPGYRVVTVLDPRCEFSPPANVDVRPLPHRTKPLDLADVVGTWCRAARGCDAAFAIAPEFDGILTAVRRGLGDVCSRVIGSDPPAIDLCTDKRELARHLASHGVATIPTEMLDAAHPQSFPPPWVVKPRDGAGSVGVRAIEHAEQLAEIGGGRAFVVQPLVRGRAVSVGVIRRDGRQLVLPIAEQRLSRDGRFTYLGGRVPFAREWDDEVRSVVVRAVRSVPGLSGYVGVDLLLPDAAPHEPVVVEINPRLTTSYLGYRELVDENLVERTTGRRVVDEPLRLRELEVAFDASGNVSTSKPTPWRRRRR